MIKRCAIYTRKSTEEGLDQSFNSLDAQREACENYILSQKSEGWCAIRTHYDDGGLSGGNMERPTLQALMQDIEDGKVNILVVYKVDRLTRSLADFAKLVERFDKHNVSFVSVTQQFNTSNSMGRLTLNVLLSFAQFEREVGAERVRDKIAASRKKGIWTGGKPPLGYNNIDKRLVVNDKESEIVREVFRIYHETQCVQTIIQSGAKNSWVTKRNPNGVGGKPLSRGPIYWILKNPIYAGLIKGKDTLYEAQHDAIIDRKVWEDVQRLLGERSQWSGSVRSQISPLASLLYWEGKRLSPSHSTRNGKRHRYYISDANKTGVRDRIRLKADGVEQAVVTAIRGWLADLMLAAVSMLSEDTDASIISRIAAELEIKAKKIEGDRSLDLVLAFTAQVDLSASSIKIALQSTNLIDDQELHEALKAEANIASPLTLKKRRNELRLIFGDRDAGEDPDAVLIKTLVRATEFKDLLFADPPLSVNEIAARLNVSKGDVSKQVRLAFLAPEIFHAIINGTGPISLTADRLRRLPELPTCWRAQQQLLSES
ncbi:MAG: recombinase family protein [Pseudomonadota bacterium]